MNSLRALLSCWILVSCFSVGIQSFTVEPTSVTQAEELKTEFQCFVNSPSQVVYVWLVNGENVQSNTEDTQFEAAPAIGSPSTLAITALPQHNGSVQCQAIVGGESVFSENATLVIKDFGPLSATPTSPTSVVISWGHIYPLSVDYHVDVRGSDGLLVQSQLVDNTGTGSTVEFTFTTPPDRGICEEYSITVTPTDGTGNSSFMQSTEQYLSSGQSAVRIYCLNATGGIQCNVNFTSTLVSGVCIASLTLSSSADEDPLLGDVPEATVELVSNGQQYMVTLPSNFPSNRFYTTNTTITIDELSDVINSQTISTHDIVSATAVPGSNGSLDTSATFVPGTEATGYLAIVADQTCSEAIFLAVNDISGASDNLEGVGPGNYTVPFFDIESNGLPMISGQSDFTGAAAMVDVSLSSGKRNSTLHRMPVSSESFSISQIGDDILVVCQSGACLFLLYDCDNPDVLISVRVDQTGTSGEVFPNILATRSGYGIGAVFLIDSETSQLSRHPVEIQFFSFAAPTVPTTSIICLLVAASIILLI